MDGPYEKWRPNLKVIKEIIQYMIKTGRFQPKAKTVGEEIEVTEGAGAVGGRNLEQWQIPEQFG